MSSLLLEGVVRGVVAAWGLVVATVLTPMVWTGEFTTLDRAPLLSVVAAAGLAGALSGAVAGGLLERGRPWRVAAVASAATAVGAVVAVLVVITDGSLFSAPLLAAVLALPLGAVAAALAVSQTWAMAQKLSARSQQERRRGPR